MGPRAVVAKQGEYGAALFTEDGFFALPGFPLEDVRDPTGAGDSFAGGFFGYLDSHEGELDDACLRRAMGYGTVLASFNVEEFGTERVARLTREEIDERFEALRAMTQFEPPGSADSASVTDSQQADARTAILALQQIEFEEGRWPPSSRSARSRRRRRHRLRDPDRHRQPHRQDLRAADQRRHRARRWTCARSRSTRTNSG